MPTPPLTSPAPPYVAQHHQRIAWLGGSTVEVLLDAAATAGALTVLRSAMAQGDSAPLHVHSAEDEVFLLLQGAATFWVGEDRYVLRDGGVAFLPRGLAHTYRVDSDEAHVLTLCTPGGFEGFFRTAGHDVSAAPVPDGWSLTPAALGAALAAHGGQVVGPPKSAQD